MPTMKPGVELDATVRTSAETGPWAWPVVVGLTVLLFLDRILVAADGGWPLGASLVAFVMAVCAVVAGVGWYRFRRHRD